MGRIYRPIFYLKNAAQLSVVLEIGECESSREASTHQQKGREL